MARLMNKCVRCNRTWKSGKDAPRRCPACDGTDVMLVTGGGSGNLAGLLVLVAVVAAAAWFGRKYASDLVGRITSAESARPAPKGPPKPAPKRAADPEAAKPPAPAVDKAEQAPAAAAPPPAAAAGPTRDPDAAAAKAAEETARREQAAREKEAERLVNLAKNYEINNLRDQAIAKYTEVIEKYPGTDAAERARSRIASLQTTR